MPCLFLPEEQMALLDTDKEYYCPFCVQDKIKVDLHINDVHLDSELSILGV